MEKKKAKESIIGLKVVNIKENIRMILKKEKEYLNGQMELYSKENFLEENLKGRDY